MLVCLLAYGGSLRHGFVSDDLHLIVDRLPDYQQRIPWAEAFTRSFWKGGGYGALPGEQKDYYRPLVTLTYALDARVWGGRPSGYHWTNLCLHILASFLVWRLLTRLVGRPAPALAAALVFAAHPIHVASVAWISGRTDLLCAVFLLAAYDRVTTSLDERMGIAARGSPRRGPGGPDRARILRSSGLGLFFYLLALLAKEMAIVFAGLLCLHVLLRRAQQRRMASPESVAGSAAALASPSARPWLEVVIVVGMTVLYFLLRLAVLGLPDFASGARSADAPFRAGVLPAILVWYWQGFLWPGALQLEVPYPAIASAADVRFLGGMALLGLHGAVTALGWRRGHPAALGAGWIVISLIPVANLVPLTFRALVAEYWAYIPSIGYAALLATALPWAEDRIRAGPARNGRGPAGPDLRASAGAPIATAILAAYAVAGLICTPGRARPLQSEETLLRHHIRANPGDAGSWLSLATEYGTRGDLRRAFEAIREAARIDPDYLGVQLCLGNLHDLSGQPDSAEAAYRREMTRHPGYGAAPANLADILLRRGERSEGRRVYRDILARRAIAPEDLARKVILLLQAGTATPGGLDWRQSETGLLLLAGLVACLEDAGYPVDAQLRLARVGAELRAGRIDWAREALLAARSAGIASTATLQIAAAPPKGLDLRSGGAAGRGTSLGLVAEMLPVLEDDPGAADAAGRAWSRDSAAAAAARAWADFYHATGKTDLAVRLWRPLLRGGVITAEELNHIAVASIRAGTTGEQREGAAASRETEIEARTPARPEDARRILLLILEEQSDFPQALLNLGGIAYGSGDRAACEKWWGLFLARHGERPEAATVRERLGEIRRR